VHALGARKVRNWPSFSGKPEDRASCALSRLEDITRLVSEMIWEVDEQGVLTFVSSRAFEILGLLPQEMIGKKLTDMGTFYSAEGEERQPNWNKPFRDVLFKIRGLNGCEHTLHVSGLPRFDNKTWQFKGVYGTAKDVTRSLEAEKSLRMLSEVIEQNPSMVFVTDLDGNFEYVNAMFTEITGYSRDDAMGRSSRLLQSGDTPTRVYKDLWDTILAGGKWHGELKDKRKDGAHFWANVAISPIRQKDGLIHHFVAVHEDITERRAAAAHLTDAKNQAEIANRVKSEILANTSHELRTPLNAIIGFSAFIKDEALGPLGNPAYVDYVNDIHESGKHLLELINDILDVASLEATQLTVFETTFNLGKCIAASVRLVMPRAKNNNLRVRFNANGHDVFILADERRMKQIFLNLLSNAVKFTPDGGDVCISIDSLDADGLCIRVVDTGIGMNADDIAKALTKFGQVDSDQVRKYTGTGLGLPLTQGLVKLHGGALDIESEKGQGTTVTVYLPKARIVASPGNS